ncbi:MAG: CopG family transcriptional regulator [Dehalococcoidia bacterium]
MDMKKTSVYLSEEDRERLKRLAERKGESQAWVLREALLAYDAATPDKDYQIFKMVDDAPIASSSSPEDLQAYNDRLDREMREGLLHKYEEEMRAAEEAMKSRPAR